MPRVLYIDQNIHDFGDELGFFYKDSLEKFDIDCIYTSRYEAAFIFLSRDFYDAIIIDPVSFEKGQGSNLSTEKGIRLIQDIQKSYVKIPIIILTGIDEPVIEERLEKNNIKVEGIVLKGVASYNRLPQKLNEVLDLNIDDTQFIVRFPEHNIRVFISYAKEDLLEAHSIYEILKQNGYRSWLDKEDLIPGQDWDLEIDKAIVKCHFFLACMSKNSVSKDGYDQKELKKGLDALDRQPEGSIYLIPVRLDECKIPRRFEKIHWCNFFEQNAIQQLLKAIRAGCEQRGLLSPSN